MSPKLSNSLRRAGIIAAIVGIVAGLGATDLEITKVPLGIYAVGLTRGAILGLYAVAIVLVYRSDRIINFSQVAIGSVGGIFFVAMITFDPMLRMARAVCPCIERKPGWYDTVNYGLALVAALVLSAGTGWVLRRLIIKRFADSPRLIATIATIFGVAVLNRIAHALPDILASDAQQDADQGLEAAGAPFDLSLSLGPAILRADQLLGLVLLAVAVPLLVVYLKRSRTGRAIRAAAENPSRASTLGINVESVGARVWLIAGLLAGIATVLEAMRGGLELAIEGGGLDINLLVRILAAAVIARLTSLPIAAVSSLALGALEEVALFSFGSALPLDAALVVIIGLTLMLQRRESVRSDADQSDAWRAAREIRPVPQELRSLPEVRSRRRWGMAVAGLVLLGMPWILSPAETNVASYVLVNAMIFLSLLVLTGWAGQISLGQFGFAAVGAWVTAVSGWPFPLALVAGGLAGAVCATIVGIPALKLRGLHLAIMSLAFSLTVAVLLLNEKYLGGLVPDELDRPLLFGMDMADERVFYYSVLVILVVVTAVVVGLRRSAWGRGLIAARDNEPAAQAFTIDLVRMRLAAFAVSGFMGAFAGGILAFQQFGIEPQAYGAGSSLTAFLYTVIGGFGSVASPLIGAVWFGIVNIFKLPEALMTLITGIGGIGLLMMTTGGLGQFVFDLRDRWLRGLAIRHRIVVPSLVSDLREGEDRRLEIKPLVRPGGGKVFVPSRYGLNDQYAFPAPVTNQNDSAEVAPHA